MASVYERFCKTVKKQVDIGMLWEELHTIFDLTEMVRFLNFGVGLYRNYPRSLQNLNKPFTGETAVSENSNPG